MMRVSGTHQCPCCKKSDWCLIGKDVIICMRVTSGRPKTFSDGTTGWLHKRDGSELPQLAFKKPPENYIDSKKLLDKWALDYGFKSLTYLGKSLGVTSDSLEKMGCVKAPAPCVWGFPMHDGLGYAIGIRLRHENGKKWCEPGSHNGLFLPKTKPSNHIVICEGPTDCAAALDIGLYPVGRPNCNGGVNFIKEFIHEHRIHRATIVADVDNDRELNGVIVNPGIQGAIALSELLGIPNRCVTLPAKDLRSFVAEGGTLAAFNAIADQNVWSR
jgi:hypothetical protein